MADVLTTQHTMSCPPGKILNPATGRCVSIAGAIGRKLLGPKSKRSSRSRSRSRPKPKPQRDDFLAVARAADANFSEQLREGEELYHVEVDGRLEYEARSLEDAFAWIYESVTEALGLDPVAEQAWHADGALFLRFGKRTTFRVSMTTPLSSVLYDLGGWARKRSVQTEDGLKVTPMLRNAK